MSQRKKALKNLENVDIDTDRLSEGLGRCPHLSSPEAGQQAHLLTDVSG